MSDLFRRLLLACVVLLLACGSDGGGGGSDFDSGTDSSARRLLIRWQSSPDVAGYVIHWGTTSGSYTDTRDVGAVVPDADGVVSVELTLAGPSGTIYFALTSYDDEGRMSAFSNELSAVVS